MDKDKEEAEMDKEIDTSMAKYSDDDVIHEVIFDKSNTVVQFTKKATNDIQDCVSTGKNATEGAGAADECDRQPDTEDISHDKQRLDHAEPDANTGEDRISSDDNHFECDGHEGTSIENSLKEENFESVAHDHKTNMSEVSAEDDAFEKDSGIIAVEDYEHVGEWGNCGENIDHLGHVQNNDSSDIQPEADAQNDELDDNNSECKESSNDKETSGQDTSLYDSICSSNTEKESIVEYDPSFITPDGYFLVNTDTSQCHAPDDVVDQEETEENTAEVADDELESTRSAYMKAAFEMTMKSEVSAEMTGECAGAFSGRNESGGPVQQSRYDARCGGDKSRAKKMQPDTQKLDDKEAALDRRIAEIKRRDEERLRRLKEIEEDKINAGTIDFTDAGFVGKSVGENSDNLVMSSKMRADNPEESNDVVTDASEERHVERTRGRERGRGRGRGRGRAKPDSDNVGTRPGDHWGQRDRGKIAPNKVREEQRMRNVEMYNEELKEISKLEDLKEDDKTEQRTNRDVRNEGRRSRGRHFSGKQRPVTGQSQEYNEYIQMTGKERQIYNEWKAERAEIEAERIRHHKRADGNWRREWDQDKEWDAISGQWVPKKQDTNADVASNEEEW